MNAQDALRIVNSLITEGDQPAPEARPDHPWEIGKIYLIRTVTMYDIGRLVAVYPHELVLEDAAWIQDTGRFANSLESCEFEEVEPFPDGRIIVGRGSIVDAAEVVRTVRDQK